MKDANPQEACVVCWANLCLWPRSLTYSGRIQETVTSSLVSLQVWRKIAGTSQKPVLQFFAFLCVYQSPLQCNFSVTLLGGGASFTILWFWAGLGLSLVNRLWWKWWDDYSKPRSQGGTAVFSQSFHTLPLPCEPAWDAFWRERITWKQVYLPYLRSC